MEESVKGLAVYQLAAVIRRRWQLGLLAFAAPLAIVVSAVISLPNIYQSTARILVEGQQVPETFVRSTVTTGPDTRLQTITQEILSRSRLEDLVNRFGLYPSIRRGASPEAVIDRMRKDVKLQIQQAEPTSRDRATVAFTISYRGAEPHTVAEVTNTLASFYIEENLKVRTRQAAGTAEFLRVQLEDTKKKLDEQERRVSEYNRRYLGELPQQMTTNLAAIETLSTQLRLNSDRQTLAMARRQSLERQLADLETPPVRGASAAAAAPAAPDTPAARLARLRRELKELRAQYTEKYPEVQRVKAELTALELELSGKAPEVVEAIPLPPDPAIQRLKGALIEADAEIQVLKTDERRLQTAIALYQTRVDNTPRREQEFQELSRDYRTTKDHYETLLKRSQEAQLAEDLEQRQKGEQFRILDPALAASEPTAPNRLRLLIVGLGLALALAVGAAVLAEHLDTSFHSVDELRTFSDIPLLVSIPRIVTVADVRARRRLTRMVAAAAIIGLLALVGGSHFIARGNERLVTLSMGGS